MFFKQIKQVGEIKYFILFFKHTHTHSLSLSLSLSPSKRDSIFHMVLLFNSMVVTINLWLLVRVVEFVLFSTFDVLGSTPDYKISV